MAANTVFAVRILHSQPRVVAVLGVQAPGNFLVTIEALKSRRAGSELVAARALRCPGQGLMGFGKRPGRDLGPCGQSCEQQTCEYENGLAGSQKLTLK